jgi:hypothetical protein
MVRSFLTAPLLLAAACASATAKPDTTIAYEFSRVGDDALTIGLGNAVIAKLNAASDFAVAADSDEVVLRIGIPTNARPRRDKGDVTVTLTLQWSHEQAFSPYGFACPTDQPEVCASEALATIRQYVATSRSASSGSGDQ